MLLAVCLTITTVLGLWTSTAYAEGATLVAGSVQAELVVDVRVYGNHNIPLADILALAGPVAGRPATSSLIRDVRRRLEQSGRFAKVEVRKRRLSIPVS